MKKAGVELFFNVFILCFIIFLCCLKFAINDAITRNTRLEQENNTEDFSKYIINIENSEDECVICYTDMDTNIGMLCCGHKYHITCINEWLNYNDICPLCRKCCRF